MYGADVYSERKNKPSLGFARAAKDQRREEACVRNLAWEKLSSTEKLKSLDARLGTGEGAMRQRVRILAEIDNGPLTRKKKKKRKK